MAGSTPLPGTRVYLDVGDQERLSYTTPELLVESLRKMQGSFDDAGYHRLWGEIIPGGIHNERAWAARFRSVFIKLFQP